MLIVAIVNEGHFSVGNIVNSTKAIIKGGILPNGMGNINNDANSIDIDEVAAVKNL